MLWCSLERFQNPINTSMRNQEHNEDRSQKEPHPEVDDTENRAPLTVILASSGAIRILFLPISVQTWT